MSPTDGAPDLELTREQLKLLREALLSAYTDFNQIRILVKFNLGDDLNDIPTPVALNPGVAALVGWARGAGQLRALSHALFEDRPGNAKVKAYRQSVAAGAAPLPHADFEKASVPATWSAKNSGLEAILDKTSPLVLAADWREAMRVAESRVCRIDGPGDQPRGTGFLVGADLVLTNCHVYRLVEGKSPVARFGYGAAGASYEEVKLKEPPLLVSSEDRLDFALLRLDGRPGDRRGWFKPAAHEFAGNQVQLILQHPDGRPLEVGIGRVTGVVTLPPRVTYSTNTEGGSSGSPAFTMDWQLVALHHYGVAGVNNVGIPIAAIWTKLAENGLVSAL